MVSTATMKLSYLGGQYRIHLPKAFVEDSQFPFKAGDEVLCTIDGKNVVMMKK